MTRGEYVHDMHMGSGRLRGSGDMTQHGEPDRGGTGEAPAEVPESEVEHGGAGPANESPADDLPRDRPPARLGDGLGHPGDRGGSGTSPALVEAILDTLADHADQLARIELTAHQLTDRVDELAERIGDLAAAVTEMAVRTADLAGMSDPTLSIAALQDDLTQLVTDLSGDRALEDRLAHLADLIVARLHDAGSPGRTAARSMPAVGGDKPSTRARRGW